MSCVMYMTTEVRQGEQITFTNDRITRATFRGDWNYSIKPRRKNL